MARAASKKALDRFEAEFEKNFSVRPERKKKSQYETIPFPSLVVDEASGVGGLVEGRLHEFWGGDAIGKTTFALMCVANFQRKYPARYAALIDMEHTFDPDWAKALGVNLDRFYVVASDTAEDVSDMLSMLMRSTDIDVGLIVVDSIGAMIPRVEFDKAADEQTVGINAKIVTRMVQKAAVECDRYDTTVVMLNQIRANISAFGKDTTTGGGFALKHSTTMKLEFKMGGTQFTVRRDGEAIPVGYPVSVRFERNKVAPKGRKATFNLIVVPSKQYGPIGVDRVPEAFTLGKRYDIIERSGAWYRLPSTPPDDSGFQGEAKVIEHLREHPEEVEDIRNRVLAAIGGDVYEEPEPLEILDGESVA